MLIGLVLHCEDEFINFAGVILYCNLGIQYMKPNDLCSSRVSNPRNSKNLRLLEIKSLERLLKYDMIYYYYLCQPKEVFLCIEFFTNDGDIVGSTANIELQQTFYTDDLNNLELLYSEG